MTIPASHYRLSYFHEYRMIVLHEPVAIQYFTLLVELQENESEAIKQRMLDLIARHRLKSSDKPSDYAETRRDWQTALDLIKATGERLMPRHLLFPVTPLSVWHEWQLWERHPHLAIRHEKLRRTVDENPYDVEAREELREFIEQNGLRRKAAPAHYDIEATRARLSRIRGVQIERDLNGELSGGAFW